MHIASHRGGDDSYGTKAMGSTHLLAGAACTDGRAGRKTSGQMPSCARSEEEDDVRAG